MKIIVTGSRGQLGSDVTAQLKKEGIEVIEASLPEIDITDSKAVENLVAESRADGVIHCAAYTNVDLAESEKELCRKINVDGTLNIARSCKNHDIPLLFTSTDYVFSGEGNTPFETDSDKAPCNFYGESKLGGENAVIENCDKYFILRISWVFGENGKNFVKTMLRLAETKSEINVVADQIGSPTYTKDLAVLICQMIKSDKYGVYHATNEGFCSWADFAEKIMEYSDLPVKINRISSDEYKSAAVRPLNSRLSKKSLDKAGFCRLPDWQDALKRFLSTEK
ncbi:MAG: dTDP-4-dehydrorhamnose reductase [Oscillospiraceae bacterium]|nr:dTDP-4-dehydrorhamnose reductase [Oscillospiraceae bacterium]